MGMAKDLAESFPEAKERFDQADDLLGVSLSDICFNGPEETLKQTQVTQPALFVHSAIVADLLKKRGIVSRSVAGHSLGELSALYAAGAYSFEQGLQLVAERSRCMQDATENNPGAMAAIIGLSPEEVVAACYEAESKGIVQPANFNSPGQIVISGSKEGVAEAMRIAKEKGAKRALELPVSGAFHSPLMESASATFATILSDVSWNSLDLPYYPNVTAQKEEDVRNVSGLLQQQLTHSVRWIECVEAMVADGVTRFIEIGPGKVLSGLVKRINGDVEIVNCGTVAEFNELVSGKR